MSLISIMLVWNCLLTTLLGYILWENEAICGKHNDLVNVVGDVVEKMNKNIALLQADLGTLGNAYNVFVRDVTTILKELKELRK